MCACGCAEAVELWSGRKEEKRRGRKGGKDRGEKEDVEEDKRRY